MSSPSKQNRARLRRSAHGFTLVEVLVALTAGLLVSASAYALARNAMKSFQDESRISGSQVGTALALGRITADVQRAGYMVSADVATDPRRCASVVPADVPLRSIQLREGGSDGEPSDAALDDKGYDINTAIPLPDALVITGNMTSTEQFEYRGIDAAGQMSLAINRGATQRAWLDAGRNANSFCEIFYPADPPTAGVSARFVRVVEATGMEAYFLVTACNAADTSGVLNSVVLTLEDPTSGSPPSTSGSSCGARPGGGLVNPVSIIRYRVGPLCDPFPCSGTVYDAVMAAQGPDVVTGEARRLELLREELDAADAATPFDIAATLPNLLSQEIIAEFAVDLDLAAIQATAAGTTPSGLALVDFDDATDPIDAVAPNLIRSLRVRFSTRARVPDRESTSPSATITRWEVPGIAATTTNRFARMRTLHTEIQLPNLSQVTF